MYPAPVTLGCTNLYVNLSISVILVMPVGGPTYAMSWVGHFVSYGSCKWGIRPLRRNSSQIAAGTPVVLSEHKRITDKLWREFFLDPSQWLDHRTEKGDARYPDFKHKKTRDALWLKGNYTPSWVEAELAAMPPGTIKQSSFSWNVRLSKYLRSGQYERTLEHFQQMRGAGVNLDRFGFVPVLTACARLGALGKGKCIHALIIQNECQTDVDVGNSLVKMYAKCRSIKDARNVFDNMPTRNVRSWDAMISGYVKNHQSQVALEMFHSMQQEGVQPDSGTYVAVFNGCASLQALELGKKIHAQILESGCDFDVYVGSSLIDMYAKCGSIDDLWRVFKELPARNVVCWTAMISGLTKCGQGWQALKLHQEMHREGVVPVPLTFVVVLNACARVGALKEGREVHRQIIRRGFEFDVFVGNSLIDMYSKCGNLEDAWSVFNKLPTRDVVAWSAIVQGCVRCGRGQKALQASQQMQLEGVEPDAVSFVGFLNACANVSALTKGRRFHQHIIRRGLESDICLGNSLVDMYAKCGSIEDAWKVFDKMPIRNAFGWSAMLSGLAMHGRATEALVLFEQMNQEDVEMDEITFISLLAACSHAGLVDEGLHYLESLTTIYGLYPTMEHYVCLVDILGRSGHLHEAVDAIEMMACEPDVMVWMSLLSSCRVHGNVEVGEFILKQVLKSNPQSSAGYVLLSNIYSAASELDQTSTVKVGTVCNETIRLHLDTGQ